MKDKEMTCRKCGRRIAVITWGVYRKVVVDPEYFMVIPDQEGEDFVRIDGTKIRGKEKRDILDDTPAEPAYRMHRKTCGTNGVLYRDDL